MTLRKDLIGRQILVPTDDVELCLIRHCIMDYFTPHERRLIQKIQHAGKGIFCRTIASPRMFYALQYVILDDEPTFGVVMESENHDLAGDYAPAPRRSALEPAADAT